MNRLLKQGTVMPLNTMLEVNPYTNEDPLASVSPVKSSYSLNPGSQLSGGEALNPKPSRASASYDTLPSQSSGHIHITSQKLPIYIDQ